MSARIQAFLGALSGIDREAVTNWLALATLLALGVVWDPGWP